MIAERHKLCFTFSLGKRLQSKISLHNHSSLTFSSFSLHNQRIVQDKKQDGKLGGEAPSDATEVTATFTANVWEVLVKPGDLVEEGQNLVILEAMKMEYPVTAPHAGKVFDVMAAASELAQQGDVLLTLEKTDAKGDIDAQQKEE